MARFNATIRATPPDADPSTASAALPIPRLLAPADAEQAVRRLLDQHFAQTDKSGPVLALLPGAAELTQRWPSRHFARLTTMVLSRWPGARIVVAGDAADRVLGTEVRTLSGLDVLNLAGQLNEAQQLALMNQADVVVCNDGTAAHLAATCSQHLVTIYGATNPASDPPMAVNAQLLSLKLTCSPCGASNCPLEHMNCLNLMEPVRVFNAIERVIQATDSSRPVQ
jgi:heptosyltransferase-2